MSTFAVIGMCAAPPAMAEATLQSVKKEISKKLRKIRTLQFSHKSERKGITELGGNTWDTLKSEKGVIRLERRDKLFVAREETTFTDKEVQRDGDHRYEGITENILVTDEKFTWESSRTRKNEYGFGAWFNVKIRRKIDHNLLDPKVRYPRDDYDQKLLREEDLDGRKTWVMEFTPKGDKFVTFASKIVVWYDQATGLEVRNVDYDENDKPTETRVYSDFKVDEKIDPKQFEFVKLGDDPVVDHSGD